MSGRISLQFVKKASASNLGHLSRSCLAGVLLCIALGAAAVPVRAADLPSKTEPPVFLPPPPAEFDWTGFYAGIHVGSGIDHFAFPYSIDVPGNWGYTQGRSGITAGGPLGGRQAGYNYALPFFHIVAGFEIDSSVSGIRGQTSVNGMLVNGLPVGATFGSKFEDFGTARVRLGPVPALFDRRLHLRNDTDLL